MKYLQNLKYILTHKWFVFVECVKLGIIWRGIVHDWSKFLPAQFFAYAEYFYGENGIKSPKGCTSSVQDAFNRAWAQHQNFHRHHYQYHYLINDDGTAYALPMPEADMKEMLADWLSFTRGDYEKTREWYLKTREEKIKWMHPSTVLWIELKLGVRKPNGIYPYILIAPEAAEINRLTKLPTPMFRHDRHAPIPDGFKKVENVYDEDGALKMRFRGIE